MASGRERLQRGFEAFAADAVLQQNVAHDRRQRRSAALEFFAHAGEDQADIVVAHGGGNGFPAAAKFFEQVAFGQFHAMGEVVEFLLALADDFHHAGEGAVLREFGQCLASHEEAVAHGAGEAIVQGGGVVFDFLARTDDEFGGGRGRGGAQVGDEVDDGEIGFVADGGDHGNCGSGDGSGEAFVVEGGEIFGGASTAGDDDDLDVVLLVE